MKKFIFGCMFFLSGFTWLTVLMVLSVNNPHVFNGVDGFIGFLLGSDMVAVFTVAVALVIIGLRIMFVETGFRIRVPDWIKSDENEG